MADHNATERHTKVLYDFLLPKEASDSPGDDEESTVGVNSNQADKPEGRGKGTVDAPWGEPPTKEHPPVLVHNSDVVVDGFIQSRQRMLDELFDAKKPAEQAEQKLMAQQLEHVRSGDFETRSILLEKKASDRTLSELVEGLLD